MNGCVEEETQKCLYQTIYGHEHNETLLQRWGDNTPPVLLFYGASGVGKFSVAMKLAYSIITSSNYGEKCTSQALDTAMHNFAHPDLQIIDVTSLDDLRAEVSRMCYLPVMAPKRVVVFKNIHQYSKVLSNSLLKLIEEPPHRTQIIMLADDINLVLPTIRSRCVKMCFYPLKQEALQRVFSSQSEEILLAGSSVGNVYALKNSNALEVYKTILRECTQENVPKLALSLAELDVDVVKILTRRLMHIVVSQCSDNVVSLMPEEANFVRGKSFNIDALHKLYQKVYVYHLYQLYTPGICYHFLDAFCKSMRQA